MFEHPYLPSGKRRWVHLALLILFVGAAIGHQAALWDWFIEDSAITFAYAKHFAEGEGMVSFVGGERVEGYSNPTWTFLLALVHLVGLDIFEAVKWIQVALCAATLPVVYFTMREVSDKDSDVPLIAPAFLAANAQFAIWGGAGLENGLLNFLIALAMWRGVVELRTKSWPLSSFLWMLVALSRPEAILYAAVAGFWQMVFTLHSQRTLLPTIKWLATFFIPFGVYHVVHYWYFAYPFPNTYYAKLEHHYERGIAPGPMDWHKRGWGYLRNWAKDTAQGGFVLFYALGVTSSKGYRVWLTALWTLSVLAIIQFVGDQRMLIEVLGGFLVLAFTFGIYKNDDKSALTLLSVGWLVIAAVLIAVEFARHQYGIVPRVLDQPEIFLARGTLGNIPSYLFILSVFILPLIGIRAKNWRLRQLSYSLAMAAVLFGILALGDWMKGFRWFSTAAVPSAFLIAFGISDLLSALKIASHSQEKNLAWAGRVLAGVLVVSMVPGFAYSTYLVSIKPDARPQGVRVRVNYVDRVRDRLMVTEKWKDLDVDQGAHLYWSDFYMLDIAGLVDLPLGHHKFNRAFIREYLFKEQRPHFAHVHDAWARNSKIPSHPEWRTDYVEIPGYPAGKTQIHTGNHIRRDLVLKKEWPHSDNRRAEFNKGITFHGVEVPSEPAQARKMFIEVGVSMHPRSRQNARMLIFLGQDSVSQTFDIPLGYDWVMPEKWRNSEVFYGRFALPLRAELKPGTYDLGVVFLSEKGEVIAVNSEEPLPADAVVGGSEGTTPWFAKGELRFKDVVTIVSEEKRDQMILDKLEQVGVLSKEAKCAQAEKMWEKARWHRAKDEGWVSRNKPKAVRSMAECWVALANQSEIRKSKVLALARARVLDHNTPSLIKAADPIADELHAEGLVAMQAEDYELAYKLFSDVMSIDASRAWSRRYAEDARSFRLGTNKAAEAAKRKEQKAKRKERVEQRKRNQKAQEPSTPEEAREEQK